MLIFDLEADGLLHSVSKIHCLAIRDTDTLTTYIYNDQGNREPIVRGIQMLEDADCIAGHNIIGYDIPVIRHFYPWFSPRGTVVDTLVISNALLHSSLMRSDCNQTRLPKKLYGSHSLEAWGYRLNCLKGDYGHTESWDKWTPEMEDYMVQDVVVTEALVRHVSKLLDLEK